MRFSPPKLAESFEDDSINFLPIKLKIFDGTSTAFKKPDPIDDPREWIFFTSGKGLVIDRNIVGRYARHPYLSNFPFFFLGRENKKSVKHTVVGFSHFEAQQIMSFLKEIIIQIRKPPSSARSFSSLIPFFDGRQDRASENPTENQQLISYFQDSDLPGVASMKLRVRRNTYGQYELNMCCLLSAEQMTAYNGNWIGPRIALSLSGMEALYSFLYLHQNA